MNTVYIKKYCVNALQPEMLNKHAYVHFVYKIEIGFNR